MRISELGQATGVPVHTLKYYLREGLLMPGEATSRTRAEYGPEHLERVRLVRALVEHGGVGIAGVRAILDGARRPPAVTPRLAGRGRLRHAHERRAATVDAEVAALRRGPRLAGGPRGTAGARPRRGRGRRGDAGVTLDATGLRRLRRGDARRGRRRPRGRPAAESPAAAMHTVVIGTVMVDPVLLALRRVAQEAVSAQRA